MCFAENNSAQTQKAGFFQTPLKSRDQILL